MKINPRKAFELRNSFKGEGNPEADIWFVGVEDGGDGLNEADIEYMCTTCSSLAEYRQISSDEIMSWSKKTKIYNYMAYILYKTCGGMEESGHLRFRNEQLAEKMFHMNRYSLPKKTKKTPLPPQYKEMFGYGQDNFNEYIEEVRNKRFPVLFEFWKKRPKGAVTICFGEGYFQDDHVTLFDLKSTRSEIIVKDKVIFYPDARVFVTPFFGRAGKNVILAYNVLDPIIKKIRSL